MNKSGKVPAGAMWSFAVCFLWGVIAAGLVLLADALLYERSIRSWGPAGEARQMEDLTRMVHRASEEADPRIGIWVVEEFEFQRQEAMRGFDEPSPAMVEVLARHETIVYGRFYQLAERKGDTSLRDEALAKGLSAAAASGVAEYGSIVDAQGLLRAVEDFDGQRS